MNEYSALKAAWHLDQIRILRAGGQIVPKQVQLIISDLCNQNCHFCAYRMDGGFSTENFGGKNPDRRIATDKAMEILKDCKKLGVKAIQFTGGGEPTVHKNHEHIFEECLNLGLEAGLVTNAVKLKKTALYGDFTWIRVSLDAGLRKTYYNIRMSDRFDTVLKNIEYLAKFDKPYIGVGFVITPENYTEIDEACRICKDLGARYVRLAAMFSDQGSKPYIGLKVEEEIEKAKLRVDSKFKIVDLYDQRIGDLNQGNPDEPFCGYQQFNMYIGADLKVYRCCTTAYTNHGEVGDLSDKSLADWWFTEEKKLKYQEFDARSCHHCQFLDKNRIINYLLSYPDHVNFV